MGLNPRKPGNVDIPASGTKVEATVRDKVGGGMTVVEVRSSPPGQSTVMIDTDPYSGRVFKDEAEVRDVVGKDYGNNPVTVVKASL